MSGLIAQIDQIDNGRLIRAIGLFGLLCGLYFLMYSGGPVSTDELIMFDGGHSLVNGRGLELPYTYNYRAYSAEPEDQLVPRLDVEPLQAYAATPFIWLAEHLPDIGLVQAAWLLNIFVTALTAVVVFYYGLLLGYSDTAALIVALVFGLATTAWPYSRMFFREPLFTLFILVCAYSLERWRRRLETRHTGIGWLLLAMIALIGGLLTKSASVLLVPMLLIVAIPGGARWRVNRRAVAVILLGVIGVIVAVVLVHHFVPNSRYDIATRILAVDWSYLPVALPAYLFSPGFSVWPFSPVLLVGFAGFISLLRTERIRQALAPLVFLLSLAVGYSVIQSTNWYGGTGWGPRYLLPTVPFLALWLLPIAEALVRRRLKPWALGIVVGIAAFSIFVQALAVLVAPEQFGTYLNNEGVALHYPINPWEQGVWSFLYNPLIVIAHEVGTPSPIAWIMNNTGALVVPLCMVVIAISVFIMSRRAATWRGIASSAGVVVVSISIMLVLGLRSYDHDPRYIGTDPVLFRTLDHINAEIRPGDAIILNDAFYQRFFMNYYKRAEPIYMMLDAPGERLGAAQTPVVVTDNPELQAHPYSSVLFPRLAARTSRWWFVTEFGPFSPGRTRATEHYLTRHYFPGEEIDFAPDQQSVPSVRLIKFAPVDAPSDMVPPWPDHPLGVDFGPAYLFGYDLPGGDTRKAGSALTVSLLWRHDGWPADIAPFDYSINVSLVNKEGAVVAQRAGPPAATFAPMSQWIVGGYYRDNHALELPADLAPGDYQLWGVVYDWSKPNANLPVRSISGGAPAHATDHVVVTTIHIAP